MQSWQFAHRKAVLHRVRLPYYRRSSRSRKRESNSKWICSGKINNGAGSCPSFPIYEDEIKPLLFEVFTDTEKDVDALIEQYAALFRRLSTKGDVKARIDSLKTQQVAIQDKQNRLLELHVGGKMIERTYLQMNEKCEKELDDIEKELEELEQELFSGEEFRKRMSDIRKTLEEARVAASQGIITPAFVNRYIDKIYVKSIDEDSANLTVKIFTGRTVDKYLRKLEKCATTINGREELPVGHMVKVIEEIKKRIMQL